MSIALSGSTTSTATLQTWEREAPTTTGNPATDRTEVQNGAEGKALGADRDLVTLSSEAQALRELQARDREVRAHEAAHAAAGGGHAGSPSYSYEKGPDGRSYAVGGEVRIDTSKVPGDPQATLEKAETIRAAALAPAQPSSADLAIAARATTMAAEARAQLATETAEQLTRHLTDRYPPSTRAGGSGTGSLLDKFA